jgi:hypothetical protein
LERKGFSFVSFVGDADQKTLLVLVVFVVYKQKHLGCRGHSLNKEGRKEGSEGRKEGRKEGRE